MALESEFGEDLEFGADVEAGADAVDAALGALIKRGARHLPARHGYHTMMAKKETGMFTYFVGANTASALAGGAAATIQIPVNTPYQIIDYVTSVTAGTFNILSFYVGDTNMFLGAASVPADVFASSVQNRFVRFTTAQRGQTIQIAVQNFTSSTATVSYVSALKVRSWRRS